MAASALIYTKTVQDAVICFLWSEAMSAAYIYQRLHAHYGESVLSRSVFEWIQKFEEDRTSVMKTQPDHPSTSMITLNVLMNLFCGIDE
jgi:hypothetical protein